MVWAEFNNSPLSGSAQVSPARRFPAASKGAPLFNRAIVLYKIKPHGYALVACYHTAYFLVIQVGMQVHRKVTAHRNHFSEHCCCLVSLSHICFEGLAMAWNDNDPILLSPCPVLLAQLFPPLAHPNITTCMQSILPLVGSSGGYQRFGFRN